MAIIIECDRCGITGKTGSHIKVVTSSETNDYHMSWEIMVYGSGMYIHPDVFGLNAYYKELYSILCRKCSEEYEKHKRQLDDEQRNKNKAFMETGGSEISQPD